MGLETSVDKIGLNGLAFVYRLRAFWPRLPARKSKKRHQNGDYAMRKSCSPTEYPSVKNIIIKSLFWPDLQDLALITPDLI